jgi:hypothetical protein
LIQKQLAVKKDGGGTQKPGGRGRGHHYHCDSDEDEGN